MVGSEESLKLTGSFRKKASLSWLVTNRLDEPRAASGNSAGGIPGGF